MEFAEEESQSVISLYIRYIGSIGGLLMDRILDALEKQSTARNLVLAIIVSAVTVSLMAVLTQTMVYDVFGEADLPDMKLGYSYEDILVAFDTLGAEGLQVWMQVHLLDLLFPLGYAFAMVFGLMMELRIAFPEKRNFRAISLLPIFAAFVDYIENTLIATQAAAYPNLSGTVISIASGFTTIKWILLYAGFAFIFILLPIALYKRIRE